VPEARRHARQKRKTEQHQNKRQERYDSHAGIKVCMSANGKLSYCGRRRDGRQRNGDAEHGYEW
jgi:hypothetical protein